LAAKKTKLCPCCNFFAD